MAAAEDDAAAAAGFLGTAPARDPADAVVFLLVAADALWDRTSFAMRFEALPGRWLDAEAPESLTV